MGKVLSEAVPSHRVLRLRSARRNAKCAKRGTAVKRAHFVLVGLAAVGTAIGAALWISSTFAPQPSRRAETASGTPEPAFSTDQASPETLEEVQRLRAKLRQKDEQLRLLSAQPKVAENVPSQVVAEPPMLGYSYQRGTTAHAVRWPTEIPSL